VLNFLAIGSYAFIHDLIVGECANLQTIDMLGTSREQQILFTLGLYLFLKFRQAPTLESFLGKFFMYTKLSILVLTGLCDIRIFTGYAIVFLILFVTVKEKAYEGPSKIGNLRNKLTFETEVMGDLSGAYTLVEFYTVWADTCVRFSSLFAKLSLRYSSENLKFKKVDLGLTPALASQYDIDISVTSGQLPTLILFQNGEPVTLHRLPPAADANGAKYGWGKKYRMTEKVITEFFTLKDKSKQKLKKPTIKKTKGKRGR
jgi:thiol-disulfide isomerase/thioredoxin